MKVKYSAAEERIGVASFAVFLSFLGSMARRFYGLKCSSMVDFRLAIFICLWGSGIGSLYFAFDPCDLLFR
jgi:hypothetical protein